MKNRLFVVSLICLFTVAAHAQTSKTASHTFDGQIVKIDVKGKAMTIKGPKEGLSTDSLPTGRGSRGGGGGGGGRGGGGRGGRRGGGGSSSSSGGGGGVDMRRLEDVQTKILWTDQTQVVLDADETKLELSKLRVGDYVKVIATMNGKKVQAITVRRVTAVDGGS